jgi:hypothetical protein
MINGYLMQISILCSVNLLAVREKEKEMYFSRSKKETTSEIRVGAIPKAIKKCIFSIKQPF